jgi:stage III sporulation protein AG
LEKAWERWVRRLRRHPLVTLALVAGVAYLLTMGGGHAASPPRHAVRHPAWAPTPSPASVHDPLLAYEASLSQALAHVLSRVMGAGEVTCAVTVSRTPRLVLAQNGSVSKEEQRGGGSVTDQMTQNLALALAQGRTIPTAELGAPVTGVVVVATGAVNPTVRLELTQAVETLFGLPANAVLVLP